MYLRRRSGFWLLALLALLVSPASVSLAGPPASPGNVGLVVAFASGQVAEYCFSVPASGVSGLALLQRTGLPLRLDYVGLGAEICAINGVGCLDPGQPCFCQCQGSPCLFWQYAQWRGGQWVAASLGSSSSLVRPGGIEGWGWGGNPPPPAGPARCALITAAPPTPRGAPPPTPRRPTPSPTLRVVPSPAAQALPAAHISPHPAPVPFLPATLVPAPAPVTAAPAAHPTRAGALPTAPAAPIPSPPVAGARPTVPPAGPPTVVPTAQPSPTAAPSAEAGPPLPLPPTPASSDPPASYWWFGLLAGGLLLVIAWARVGRQRR